MGDKSKIAWCDATWTPIQAVRRDNGKRGVACIKVSPACQNCYAERFNMRNLPSHGTGLPFTVQAMEQVDIVINDEILLQPLSWKKPRRIFVCSQTDLFGEFVSDEQIDRVLRVMASASHHTFQVLTKRADRMHRYLSAFRPSPRLDGFITRNGVYHDDTKHGEFIGNPGKWPLSNVWLGVTAENQEWADKRIPLLLQTPAAKRFVSVEPMLGPVDFFWIKDATGMGEGGGFVDALNGYSHDGRGDGCGVNRLDWVICGGESGHGARPMHPDWARSLRDQSQAAGVPFMFKQWGSWQNGSDEDWKGKIVLNDGRRCGVPEELDQETRNNWPSFRPTKMAFVGKKKAGRLLDGREWNEFPEVANG